MQPPAPQPSEQPPGTTPGKIRTWWHPLLASILRWQLGEHYHLEEEVNVGQKPLQIDILLLHREQGELPESARQILAGLVERLGEYTLLEFKSPSDTLRAGNFQTFLAYAFLYRAQNLPLLELIRMHLLVLAPQLTRPDHDELRTLGVTADEQDRGVWRLHGGPAVFPTWLLETNRLVGPEHPLLSLVSQRFLRDRLTVYHQLRQGGYTNLVVYLGQQIHQFRRLGPEFAMQHLGAEDQMEQVLRDFLASLPVEERLRGLSPEDPSLQEFLASLPVEERLRGLSPEDPSLQEFLASLPVEERLRGLSPEDPSLQGFLANLPAEKRLEGISAEERLRGLSPEELQRLRQLLYSPTKPDDSSRKE
jgi:hypothetical protein